MFIKRKFQEMGGVIRQIQEDLNDGILPSFIMNDENIFSLEKERIFSKAWICLAHESEIPNPGDYVVRYIVDDSFIVVRGEDGEIRVFYNACTHRGMQVCRVEMGNTSHFRCPYHGWTFKNNGKLIGVPHGKQIYGEDGLDKEKWGLSPSPQYAVSHGLIFACLDENAISLDEYLSDFKWYLDLYLNKSAAGMEVIGSPQRWIVDADWKLAADNFITDGYHTAVSHHSALDIGALPVPNADFHKEGVQVFAGRGGAGFIHIPPNSYMGYPEEIVHSLKQNLRPEQVELLSGNEHFALAITHGTLFPNLSFLNAPGSTKPGGPPVPYLTMRVWQPLGPGKMEVWSWFLIEKDAPDWFKKESYKSYVLSFGSSGTLEQDDTENWRSMTKVAKGTMARSHYLNIQMGMKTGMEPMTDWPGPGRAYPIAYNEANGRSFYRLWANYMMNNPNEETI